MLLQLYFFLLQELKPKAGDIRPKLLENMALIATKQKGNIEKALNAFMEISTNEVSYRSVDGNLILCKEGKVGIPLTGLTTAHFCVHPMSDLDFQRHVFFFFCVFSEYV